MMNPRIMAEMLRQWGMESHPRDSRLAYITPAQEHLLERLDGHAGTIDPVTGLEHHDDGGEDGGPSDSGMDGGADNGAAGSANAGDPGVGSTDTSGNSEGWSFSYGTPGDLDAMQAQQENQGRTDTAFGKGGELEGFAQGLNDLASSLSMSNLETGEGYGKNTGKTYGYDNYNHQYAWYSPEEWDAIQNSINEDALGNGRTANTTTNAFGQWISEHPSANKAITAGLTFINPALGMVYGLASKGSEGKTGAATGGLIGALSGVPGGSLFGSAIGDLASHAGSVGLNNTASNATSASNGSDGSQSDALTSGDGIQSGAGSMATQSAPAVYDFKRPTGGYTRGASLDSKTQAIVSGLRGNGSAPSYQLFSLPNSYLEGVRRRYYGD